MSVKSKKMRKAARTAAMSALIVSAIVGTTVIASAADNSSTISSGIVKTTGGGDASALKVTGGTLYVDSAYATNAGSGDVKNMGPLGTQTNAWVTGGSIIVGKTISSSGVVSAAVGKTLTVDNMTIDGGTVVVTNSSILVATQKDITINAGGTLELSGEAGNEATGSNVKAVNINVNGGTVVATQGLQNQLVHTANTGAVNLRGGTIAVAAGASLTIASSDAKASGEKGTLMVRNGGIFNSFGGTIAAGLNSSGATSFKSGTTTVDNLTVAGGTTLIEGNATVNVLGDKASISSGAALDMKGGTLRVAGGAGTLAVDGTLNSKAGINTVDASVAVSNTGVVNVSGSSTLTITKNLSLAGAGKVTVAGGVGETASLILNGNLTTVAANSIQVGDASTATKLGTLTIGHGALTASTVHANSIKMGDGTGTGAGALNGTLIVKDYAGAVLDVTGADATTIKGKTTGGVLGGDYEKNNVVIWGKELTNGGTAIEAKTDGTKSVTAGVDVKINAAAGSTPTLSADIKAPSVSTSTGDLKMTSGGSVNLLGLGMGNAENQVTTLGALEMVANTNFAVNDGATLNTKTLKMDGGKMDVINATANLGVLEAVSGTIFVDPAIVNIDGLVNNNLGNVGLLSGAGSIVTLGGDTGWMAKPMADAGFAYGTAGQATIGIKTTDTITIGATGSVVVDDTVMEDPANSGTYKLTKVGGTLNDITVGAATAVGNANTGAFWAGANSLTVIDASGLAKGEAVFSLDTANLVVNIADGAKLHVANLTVNGLTIFTTTGVGGVIVGDGAGNVYTPGTDTGWAGNNVIQPDRMLTTTITGAGVLEATANAASNALGMSTEFNDLMGGVWGNALNSTHSGSAGIRFVSRAASTDYGLSTDQAAKTIEGAAQMGAVAGVQGVTMGAANAATSAIATRTSFAQPLMDKTKAVAMHVDSDGSVSLDAGLNAGNGMKNGFALWIMPLYQSNNVWGMDAGNFKSGYNSDLGGVALGADYTINDMFRFGAALNIGAGYSESSGDFNSTDNSFNFWGINLYGGWTMNNFGVTADVGYTGNYNKVEQEVPMSLQVPNLKSDINSSALTAGVKAEYKLETSVMDIIPHVGVRYMGLTTDEYSVKGGGTVFKVDQDHQTIWTFPIGVTLSKTMETGSGWMFKPQLDLAVIPAAGDVEARSKSRIPGAPGSAEAKMQVVDYVTFDGGVGFDFSNENLSFGLNYNIQASEHRTGHGVFGTVRYEF